jgi:hypothetical protein
MFLQFYISFKISLDNRCNFQTRLIIHKVILGFFDLEKILKEGFLNQLVFDECIREKFLTFCFKNLELKLIKNLTSKSLSKFYINMSKEIISLYIIWPIEICIWLTSSGLNEDLRKQRINFSSNLDFSI